MISCWLRMADTGDFSTCEEKYVRYADMFDMVHPINGGKLKADGSIEIESWKRKGFGERLQHMAKDNQQLYIPVVHDNPGDMPGLLEHPERWQSAIDSLILMIDSWDGVMLDFEKELTKDTREQLSQFYYLLSYHIRKEKKICVISVRGNDGKGNDYPTAYGHDLRVIAQCADYVDYRLYGYWNPKPRTRAPYYWIIDSINYAIEQGIPRNRLLFGSGTYSNHWVNNRKTEVPYDKAMELSKDIQWIDENENGTVRESYSDTPDGHIWIADYHTVKRDRDIADKYLLAGVSLFTPSGSSDGVFRALQ